MKVYGGIYFDESGIGQSIRSMHLQSELLGNINQNINGFDKVGYQREEAVVSSFSEHVGAHALSNITDESVGRLVKTGNSLDFALGKTGYFQYKTPEGIKLTRDGRFEINKDGRLVTQEGFNVLSRDGVPIKFNKVPQSLSDVVVSVDGQIQAIDRDTSKLQKIASISVVQRNGKVADEVDVRQNYVESSNVRMQDEFFNLIPVRRNFEANRQLLIMQNDELTKAIQELGRPS